MVWMNSALKLLKITPPPPFGSHEDTYCVEKQEVIWSILSTLVLFGPIQSTLVLFGQHRSYSIHPVHFGLIRSIWSTLILSGPIQSTLVLFGQLRSYSVHPVHLVLFGPIQFILTTLVFLGPIQSTLLLFSPFFPLRSNQSCSVHFHLIWSYSMNFSPIWFYSVHFSPFIAFSPFLCIYIIWKNRFGLRAPILNPNLVCAYIYLYVDLKFVISKILSITFIIITFLLSHINIVFHSTLVWLNLSASLSKYEKYEHTNVIFRAITHLF